MSRRLPPQRRATNGNPQAAPATRPRPREEEEDPVLALQEQRPKRETLPNQKRGHSKEKQANWPREDGGRGRISLRRDDAADWDLSVYSSCGGFREIRQHSERILAKPQGVLPVRDGSYKSTHQPMHHSARRLYHSNAAEVIG